jgi:hypothetical protein
MGIRSSVGKTVTTKRVMKSAKVKSSKGAMVTLRVSRTSRKVCRVVNGSIKMIGKGTCSVTVTMKPVKGKSTKGSTTITA